MLRRFPPAPFRSFLALAAIAAFVSCGSGQQPAAPTADVPDVANVAGNPAASGRVLLISIDGLRPDALQSVRPPNLMALVARGASTLEAFTISPPETLPAHGSMITGVDPAVHGITWGEYQPQLGLIKGSTIFTAAKAAGRSTALVAGKNGFRHYLVPGSVDHFADLNGGAAAVATNAMGLVATTDLVMVHFADVDLAGHRSGWMGTAYLNAVRTVDAEIGRLLGVVGPDTTVIVTADHGGTGLDHLGGASENVNIPWMIAGPRVAAGRPLGMGVCVKDTASTVLHLLGVPRPAGMGGRVVIEAFAGR